MLQRRRKSHLKNVSFATSSKWECRLLNNVSKARFCRFPGFLRVSFVSAKSVGLGNQPAPRLRPLTGVCRRVSKHATTCCLPICVGVWWAIVAIFLALTTTVHASIPADRSYSPVFAALVQDTEVFPSPRAICEEVGRRAVVANTAAGLLGTSYSVTSETYPTPTKFGECSLEG